MLARTNWRSKFLAAALAATTFAAFTVPAVGQISVVIGRTPPPLRYERRPPPPGEGFVWVDGYWRVDRGRYVWAPGVWQRATVWRAHTGAMGIGTITPRAGATTKAIGTMKSHDDHHDWDHHDHDDHDRH